MTRPHRPQSPLARVLRVLFVALVLRPLMLLVLGVNVRRRELLPSRGPALVVANHNSHLDALLLLSLFPLRHIHRVRPVAAADYFLRNPVVAWFSTHVIGIIPIDRLKKGAKAEVLRPVEDALDEGSVVIFFPEGTRGEPEQRAPFKRGVAFLAARYPEVPVHPVYLHGLGKALPRGEALLVPFVLDAACGDPIHWTGDRDGFLAELVRRIEELATEVNPPEWY